MATKEDLEQDRLALRTETIRQLSGNGFDQAKFDEVTDTLKTKSRCTDVPTTCLQLEALLKVLTGKP